MHAPARNTRPAGYVPALSYRALTPYYDAVVGATTRERRFKQALIAEADIKPGQQVLDLACGTGTLALWVKQQHPLAMMTGVDGDAEILQIAAQKLQAAKVEVQLDCALSYALPYDTARFDRVLSSLFFHHLSWPDKQRTAAELFRVLKPGAELHVADWGAPDNLLMRGLFLSIQWLDGFNNTRDHVAGRLIELFQSAGFSAVEQRHSFSTVYGTMALYRAIKS